ncbi:MAG TPA: hypothetical protein VJR89_04565, partial [Polyangiales bacterium]|nr:hypothetical protein [Polyangiales bacterium]
MLMIELRGTGKTMLASRAESGKGRKAASPRPNASRAKSSKGGEAASPREPMLPQPEKGIAGDCTECSGLFRCTQYRRCRVTDSGGERA